MKYLTMKNKKDEKNNSSREEEEIHQANNKVKAMV